MYLHHNNFIKTYLSSESSEDYNPTSIV